MTETAHTPLPYECFQDRSYYDMWCVRRVNEREWGKGFHLVNGDEAAALRDLLNTRADSHPRLIEALGRMIEIADAYGEYISQVPSAELERHPYLPGLEDEINDARAALKEAGR